MAAGIFLICKQVEITVLGEVHSFSPLSREMWDEGWQHQQQHSWLVLAEMFF